MDSVGHNKFDIKNRFIWPGLTKKTILLLCSCLFCSSAFAQDQYFTDESAVLLPDTAVWSLGADVGDIDGDGDYDICVAKMMIFGDLGPSYLLVNDGNGRFYSEGHIRFPPATTDSYRCEFGDVDNDGDIDLYVGNDEGIDYDLLLINDGLGFFEDQTGNRMPVFENSTTDMRFADLTEDFSIDILLEGYYDYDIGTRLLENDDLGYFSDISTMNLPPDTNRNISCTVFDMDNDLDLDILEGDYFLQAPSWLPFLLENTGGGYFSDNCQNRIPFNIMKYSYAGDLDLDGDLDLLTVIQTFVRVWINDGFGVFTDESTHRLPSDLDPQSVYRLGLGDFDNDGDLDIIAGNLPDTCFLVNDGAGYFTIDRSRLPGNTLGARWIEPFDADGDGDLDLFITTTGNGHQQIYINHSTPDTIPPNIITNTIYGGVVDSMDYYPVRISAWDNVSVALGELTGILHYRINNSGYVELDLLPLGGTIFGERIPGQSSGTRIEYYMEMVDRMGNTTNIPSTAPDSVYGFWVEEVTAIEEDETLPQTIGIFIYPNPFNSMTTVTVKNMKGGDVGIEIYDIRGRLIRDLTAYNIQGGDKKAAWDAHDNSGKEVSGGVYFAKVSTPQAVKVKKLLFLR